jgi:Tfp pilus assembly protein PilF
MDHHPNQADNDVSPPTLKSDAALHTASDSTRVADETTGNPSIASAPINALSDLAQIEANIKRLIEETRKGPALRAQERLSQQQPLSLPCKSRSEYGFPPLPCREKAGEREPVAADNEDTKKPLQGIPSEDSEQKRLSDRINFLTCQIEKRHVSISELDATINARHHRIETLMREKSQLVEPKIKAEESALLALENCQSWQQAATQEISAHANTLAERDALQKRAEQLRLEIEQHTVQAQIEYLNREPEEIKPAENTQPSIPENISVNTVSSAMQNVPDVPDHLNRISLNAANERDELHSRLQQLETMIGVLVDNTDASSETAASPAISPVTQNLSRRLRMRDVIFISLCSAAATLFLLLCLAFFIARNSVASTDAVVEQRSNNNRRRGDKEGETQDAGAALPPDTPVNRLLESARLWVEKDRLDLALDAARKARLLEPDNPMVLARIGELELKANHGQQALELLQQLQSRHPDAEATRELEDAYRIATKDRMAMATVDFLGRVAPSRMEPAIRALRALFPNGAPHGELGLVYYHTLGRANGHQAEAKAGLERLVREMPNDPRPQLELAVLLMRNPATLLKGLDQVAGLAHRDDIKRLSILKVWSDGLSDLERNANTERFFSAFAAAFPDEPVPYKQLSAADIASRRKQQRADQVDKLILSADAARDNQQMEEAQRLLGKALQLEPANREALLSLAKIQLTTGNYAHAQELFGAVLQTDPVNSRAVNGMIDTLAAKGNRKEALEYAENYVRAHPQQAEDIADTRASLLRAESGDLLKRGQDKQAVAVLEQGVSDIPSSAWLRYDLANQYARMGLIDKGKKLFGDIAAGNAENCYAEALFLSGQGDNYGAISALESIAPEQRSDSVKALLLKSAVRADLAQAVQAQMKGSHSAAVKLLQHAETLAKDTPDLTWECAEGWTDINEPNRALALSKRLQANAEPSLATDNALHYARLLYKAGRNTEFNDKISAIDSKNNVTKEQKENLLDLKRMYAIREAWELRSQGKAGEAEALLSKTLEQQPHDVGLLTTLADILSLEGDPEAAGEIYRKLISKNPKAFDIRLSHAKALRKMGKNEESQDEIARLGKEIPLGDRSNRLTLAERLAEEEDFMHAREIINDLLRTQPNDKKTLLQAAGIEEKAREYENALNYFQQVQKQGVSGSQISPEDAALVGEAALKTQEIERRRYGYVTSGVDYRGLSGTSGMSQVTNLEAPVYMQYPIGYSGHVFAQTDYATVLAGQLAASNYSLFGKINALVPNPATSLPNNYSAMNQQASGAPIAVGYKNDNWRFDIGSTPLGFPVTTAVGGVHYSGSWGKGYYSWDLARRALPNSLLSYAGAHDPVTGAVWGGVKANGGGIYAGTDYGRLGLFAQGSAHYLEGQNVQSNADIMLRTGADWAFIDQPDMRLTVGIAGMYWKFANNQRHYTYGYGGYWSPQTYLSIAPPIQWTGRWGDLSYLFRGYVSYSYSSENGGAYYPISPDLQSSALNGNATYSGTSGTAVSWGLRSVLEYQVAPQLFLGGRAEIARSPFYTPNYFGLYFRYAFDERTEKIPYPPEPPVPYYRY